MVTFITRRALLAVITLFIVITFVFLVMRLLPGDPILVIISASETQTLTEEQILQLKQEFGLDKPLWYQYIYWVGDLLRGNFGNSILWRTPVIKEILMRLPVTLHLGLIAWFIGIIVGIPMGVVCAVRRNTYWDTIVTFLANIGITAPVFLTAFFLIFIFGLWLDWLPVQGYTSPFENFWLSTKQAIMPIFCLSVFPIASTVRQTRSSMLEVMQQDFVRTAMCKGLTERQIILRHMLKNALIPVITLNGLGCAIHIGGQVIIDNDFNIHCIGRLMVHAILSQDYPVVQGVVFFIASVVMIINLIVDILYGWFDPRISYEK